MKKKWIATIVMTAMLCGLLVGCGDAGEAGSSGSGGQPSMSDVTDGENVEDSSFGGEDDQREAALTTQSVVDKGVIKLRFIFYGDMTARREEYFKTDFHDRVLNDLNIDLTVETLPWGSANNVATMLASGEAFACYWNTSSGPDWPSKGYLSPIDYEMIQALCPNLIQARGENNGFECVKYNGEIYGIPFGNRPYSGSTQAFDVRNDILRGCGYEASDIHTYDQLMEVIAAVHEKYPNLRILRSSGFLANALRTELSDQVFGVADLSPTFAYVDELEEGDQVYSYYESETYKNICRISAEWAELGYISKDELTNPTQGVADWESGNCLFCYGMPGAYISTSLKMANPDAEEKLIVLDGIQKIKGNDYDWGIAISATDGEHTDRWLTLFNWMYQDQEHYNFCVYGVEGKDFVYNEDGTINRLCADSFIDSWFMEAIPYNIYDPSISQESIELYINWDNDAVTAKSTGFQFDSSPVSSELAMMTAVYDEMLKPMSIGLLDFDKNYADAVKQLKDAGLDAYLAEYQRQFTEWYEEK